MALDRITPTRRRRRRQPAPDATPRVIAYLRVSTDEQADSRAGMDAQRDAIRREAESKAWTDVRWIEDAGVSGKSLDRPGMDEALDLLAVGEADVLAVSKLDRVSRSVADFCMLADRAEREGWSLRVLDLGLDMTTPTGRMQAQMLAVFAEFERRMISQRTRDALRQKAAEGVRIGRPRGPENPLRRRLVDMRRQGMSYRDIAVSLNADGTPTRTGAPWSAPTVRYIVVKGGPR